jgi:hypothetical protein
MIEARRKGDSNPRTSFPVNGFQDRRFQPLTHSSNLILSKLRDSRVIPHSLSCAGSLDS